MALSTFKAGRKKKETLDSQSKEDIRTKGICEESWLNKAILKKAEIKAKSRELQHLV